MAGPSKANLYQLLIEKIFLSKFTPKSKQVKFKRDDIREAAQELNVPIPKNLGDLIYSFRYRATLPKTILDLAPKGTEWQIRSLGRSEYAFVAARPLRIEPTLGMAETKILDATPGMISRYALTDEQALLAKLRYNRLIDIFTGVTCYSLQSHLRTSVPNLGGMETDEVYVGVDGHGVHYVFPVQAKGGRDRLSEVQIQQDVAMCGAKFPDLVCRPIGAQFLADDLIALFLLEDSDKGLHITSEKQYRLVQDGELNSEDLETYKTLRD